IAELDNEIEREHYIQQLSRLVQLDERTIAGRAQAAARTSAVQANARSGAHGSRIRRMGIQKRPAASSVEDTNARSEPALDPSPLMSAGLERFEQTGLTTEDYLLAHLLREPDLLIWLAGATAERELSPVETTDWQHVENQEIFRLLKRWMSSD